MIEEFKKLYEFADWLEEEQKKSQFTMEAWEALMTENIRLHKEIKLCRRQHNKLFTELSGLKEKMK
jgi:hypothetical protein